jgi:hypothetical protein
VRQTQKQKKDRDAYRHRHRDIDTGTTTQRLFRRRALRYWPRNQKPYERRRQHMEKELGRKPALR